MPPAGGGNGPTSPILSVFGFILHPASPAVRPPARVRSDSATGASHEADPHRAGHPTRICDHAWWRFSASLLSGFRTQDTRASCVLLTAGTPTTLRRKASN